MNSADDRDRLTPAEQALIERLQTLEADRPTPSAALVPRIIHAARWQRTLRRPLMTIGSLAGAALDGLRLLIGSSHR